MVLTWEQIQAAAWGKCPTGESYEWLIDKLNTNIDNAIIGELRSGTTLAQFATGVRIDLGMTLCKYLIIDGPFAFDDERICAFVLHHSCHAIGERYHKQGIRFAMNLDRVVIGAENPKVPKNAQLIHDTTSMVTGSFNITIWKE